MGKSYTMKQTSHVKTLILRTLNPYAHFVRLTFIVLPLALNGVVMSLYTEKLPRLPVTRSVGLPLPEELMTPCAATAS